MNPLSAPARRLIEARWVERALTDGKGITKDTDPAVVEIVRYLEGVAGKKGETS